MKRWGVCILVAVAAVAFGTILSGPSVAETTSTSVQATTTTVVTQDLPIVTIQAGPTVDRYFFAQCQDAGIAYPLGDSYVVSRSDATAEVTVTFDVDETFFGTWQGDEVGIQPVPTSGNVTMSVGVAEVVLPIAHRFSSRGVNLVKRMITLSAGVDYVVGPSASASVQFIVERDPALPPYDCVPQFQFTSAASNTEQSIALGEVPFAPVTTLGTDYQLSLVSGELPMGISIGADEPGDLVHLPARFVGAASRLGDSKAVLKACGYYSWLVSCRQTTLTIHVIPVVSRPRVTIDDPEVLPITGNYLAWLTPFGFATALLGFAMAFAARPRRRA